MATRTITKLLIANRGEIAVRIIMTCKKLGISTVVAFTVPDAETVAVKSADFSVCIGEYTQYLSIDTMIQVAKNSGCDAVHPGFGFLAENADFSRRCSQEGLIFIGPTPESINAMGSKAEAKRLLQDPKYKNSVPVIPGYNGVDQSDQVFIREAVKMGFPVLLKASAGGGGKGMRVVWKAEDMATEIASARRESKDSFGDDTLLLEKYFAAVRHVEIQIFSDSQNNCISLGERDCSIQRRHQKIIEETPSPALNENLRKKMSDVAVTIARAIHYLNAGTVEFILEEGTQNFYFLEVNTRLQVEHPITEAVTGLDLVELQIRIAEGFTLSQLGLNPSVPVSLRGHAIECRLYAEDTNNNFLPSPGRLVLFNPASPDTVRYDSGVESGSEITMYYDPMIAKVITWGASRKEAIMKMKKAIAETIIVGLTTNQAFLLKVLSNPDFIEGHYNTHFIQNHDLTPELFIPFHEMSEFASIASMLFVWSINREKQVLHRHVTPGFRNNFYRYEYKKFSINGTEHKVSYKCLPQTHAQNKNPYRTEQKFEVFFGEKRFDVTLDKNSENSSIFHHPYTQDKHGLIFCTINEIRASFFMHYSVNTGMIHVQSPSILGRPVLVKEIPKLVLTVGEQQNANMVSAMMTGKIVSVLTQPNEQVQEGDVVMIMESMKMETKLRAPKEGRVKEVYVAAGQVVEEGTPLLLLE
eukprot:TRINITY_DN5026_c0_g1_i1.p1 TRINITY_DN5026_c0_g1~~TRINITY_DN5026_c0_g1_i1.p1  ORF type:complete len:705 (-),score=166.30 TRINITY_DN5026_c0_g1_i1:21-2111(-)